MIRRPPRSTRTDTLFPYTTLFRSIALTTAVVGDAMRSQRQVVDANPDALARIEWRTDVIQMPLVTIGHVIAGCGRFAYVFGADFATLVVDHLLRHRLSCRIAAAVSAGIATAALIICNKGIAHDRQSTRLK